MLGLPLYHLSAFDVLDAIYVTFWLHLFLYLLVSWAWWDWPLTWLTNHCPAVLWHCWLGHATRQIVSEMTSNVSSRTLNPTIPYHRRWHMCVRQRLSKRRWWWWWWWWWWCSSNDCCGVHLWQFERLIEIATDVVMMSCRVHGACFYFELVDALLVFVQVFSHDTTVVRSQCNALCNFYTFSRAIMRRKRGIIIPPFSINFIDKRSMYPKQRANLTKPCDIQIYSY